MEIFEEMYFGNTAERESLGGGLAGRDEDSFPITDCGMDSLHGNREQRPNLYSRRIYSYFLSG